MTIDMQAFLERAIERRWPFLWLDATYVKVREHGRVVSKACVIVVGVNTEGAGCTSSATSSRTWPSATRASQVPQLIA